MVEQLRKSDPEGRKEQKKTSLKLISVATKHFLLYEPNMNNYMCTSGTGYKIKQQIRHFILKSDCFDIFMRNVMSVIRQRGHKSLMVRGSYICWVNKKSVNIVVCEKFVNIDFFLRRKATIFIFGN